MEAVIKPLKVEVQEKKQIYFIDQFQWFPDGLESGSVPHDITRRSAVSFEFPHSPGQLARAELLVLGEKSELEAYLISPDNEIKNITIQRVFCYPGRREKIDRSVLDLNAVPSPNVFTTQETPFLYRGEKSGNFSREYLFNLFGGEYFKVTAQRKEPSKFDYMELEYLPNPRGGEPLTIARIINDGIRWFLEDERI